MKHVIFLCRAEKKNIFLHSLSAKKKSYRRFMLTL